MPKVEFESHSGADELAYALNLMLFFTDWAADRTSSPDEAIGWAGWDDSDWMLFELQGRGFETEGVSLGRLVEGRIERIDATRTFYSDEPWRSPHELTITDLNLRVETLAAAVEAERRGEDKTAVEDILLGLDWEYHGRGNDDVLTRDAMSVDGVQLNMRGDDDVRLRGGRDHWFSGHGDDVVDGGAGRDFIDGGAGDDALLGRRGGDTLHGSGGNDRLRGGQGEDALFGGRGGDRLSGGSGDDTLKGGRGYDALHGGTGRDVIEGGDGRDRIEGGRGKDVLDGGRGRDTFVFDDRSGRDVIEGFDVGRDRLVIETDEAVYITATRTDRGEPAVRVAWGDERVLLEGLTGADLDRIAIDFDL